MYRQPWLLCMDTLASLNGARRTSYGRTGPVGTLRLINVAEIWVT